MLSLVLLISTLGLVPGQPPGVLGVELLALGIAGAIWGIVHDVGTWRQTEAEFRPAMARLLPLGLVATLATAVAGASLLVHVGGGLYWLVPAIICAFLAALVDAWVLLIEIVR
jgi:modulator of FtsH protease